MDTDKRQCRNFNPRCPYGQRLIFLCFCLSACGFQSTLSLRTATPVPQVFLRIKYISIHAVLTDSDAGIVQLNRGNANFNPRCPYGQRQGTTKNGSCANTFQSTLSLRTATSDSLPPPFCIEISIHAVLTDSDWRCVRRADHD